MKYKVLFVSSTGNTENLAKEIYYAIPGKDKDIERLDEHTRLDPAETCFIGFWTNRGICNFEVMEYISELHGKNIALFGTCGMGNVKGYYKQIENKVSAMIPEDNVYLGIFMCQGKMPMHVRDKYEELLKLGINDDMAINLLHNFDQALLHPNQEDFGRAREFVETVLERMGSCVEG